MGTTTDRTQQPDDAHVESDWGTLSLGGPTTHKNRAEISTTLQTVLLPRRSIGSATLHLRYLAVDDGSSTPYQLPLIIAIQLA